MLLTVQYNLASYYTYTLSLYSDKDIRISSNIIVIIVVKSVLVFAKTYVVRNYTTVVVFIIITHMNSQVPW